MIDRGGHSARAELPGRTRRALMLAIGFAIVYGNAAVALQPPALQHARFHLPCPTYVIDAFLMTGMFGSYSTYNTDLVIVGARTEAGAPDDRGRWIELHLGDFFSAREGVMFTQLFSAHEWDMHGRIAQRRSFAVLARKIRERHNRLHPRHPVARVGFGVASWPQSPLGYRVGKRSAHGMDEPWFVE